MTESEWLECSDPERMLEFLQGKASDRKLRLFAVACCRRIWHLIMDEENRYALEVAERFADNLATDEERAEAAEGVVSLDQDGEEPDPEDYQGSATYEAQTAVWQAVTMAAWEGAGEVARSASAAAADATGRNPSSEGWTAAKNAEAAAQADLLRELLGPLPFRRVPLNPAWLTPTVKALAHAIYQGRAKDRMPDLVAALKEAGCTDADIFHHCRSEGLHRVGCWVVDLILGKE